MLDTLIVLSVFAIPASVAYLGLHFGSKWIDRQLCVPPPLDLNKPIVLPHLQDRLSD